MLSFPIYFMIFPDARRKLCFSRAQYIRVLQYEGWSREEARQAIELVADGHPNRWMRVSPKRCSSLKILTTSSSVGKAAFSKLKSFWKSNATDLGTLEPKVPVLRCRCVEA